MKRYLALDSSLSKTGWAIISVKDRKPAVEACGLVKTNAKQSDGDRLRDLHAQLSAVLAEYDDLEAVIPIEEGIVRFNTATKQIAKARGVIEFSFEGYTFDGVNIQSVKKWARERLGGFKGKVEKEHIAQAVEGLYGSVEGVYTARGKLQDDVSDAIGVATVWLLQNKVIDE